MSDVHHVPGAPRLAVELAGNGPLLLLMHSRADAC